MHEKNSIAFKDPWEDSEFIESEFSRCPWAKTIEEPIRQRFLAMAKVARIQDGEVVQELGDIVSEVYFLLSGTLRVHLVDDLGREVYQGDVGRGGAVGLLASATQESSRIRAIAMEPSVALCLSMEEILNLGVQSKAFQRAMLELSAGLFARVSIPTRKHAVPSVVAFVHHSKLTVPIVTRVANRLCSLGELPCVMSDLPCEDLDPSVAFESLVSENQCIPASQRRATIKSWASRGRLLLNLTAPNVGNELVDFLNYAEKIFWCVAEGEEQSALKWITEIEDEAAWVKEKLILVWSLSSERVSPWIPNLVSKINRDFKVTLDGSRANEGSQLSSGVERIVHYLRGVQIGLALGGGAARGMAHLGVLKALEKQGIVVDRIAGTSAGAMTGTVYSLGLDPEYATNCFQDDLLPPWIFRQSPGGGYWYLLYKYRSGAFDPMLRKYLKHYRLEQLPVPMTTVSVDLVEGEPRVTSSGDATRAILESINLPPLSLPLIDDARAIVDGGLLNNVPADVLVSQGCNVVIASTVTAKLERDFMEIRKRGRAKKSLFFNSIKVMMRQALVQSYSMNAVGVSPADFVIAPDVTQFDISEFTRADEMAEIGYQTTMEASAELISKLRMIDAKLF